MEEEEEEKKKKEEEDSLKLIYIVHYSCYVPIQIDSLGDGIVC